MVLSALVLSRWRRVMISSLSAARRMDRKHIVDWNFQHGCSTRWHVRSPTTDSLPIRQHRRTYGALGATRSGLRGPNAISCLVFWPTESLSRPGQKLMSRETRNATKRIHQNRTIAAAADGCVRTSAGRRRRAGAAGIVGGSAAELTSLIT